MRSIRPLAFALASLLAASCDDGSQATCSGVACSGHGTCVEAGGVATCECDPGYQAAGPECVSAKDPCDPNPCLGNKRTVCSISDGAAVCSCEAGWRDDGAGGCLRVDPCSPNPCVEPHKTVCTASGSAATCSCDPGWAPSPSGACQEESQPDCAAQHDDGDSFEPDECPKLARAVIVPASENHTIQPAGDVDWLRFEVQGARRLSFAATSSGMTPALVLYRENAVDALAQDVPASGEKASLARRLETGAYFLKIRASVETAVGSYALALADEGPDDHGDTPAESAALSVGTPQGGALEYPGDLDVFAFEAVAGRIYKVSAVAQGAEVELVVLAPDGTTPVATQSGVAPAAYLKPVTGRHFVRIRAKNGAATPAYTVRVEDLGRDDFGDDFADSAKMAPGTPVDGAIQFPGDVDVLRFEVVPGRIYRVAVSSKFQGDVSVSLWESASASKPAASDWARSVSFTWKPASAGPWFLQVRAFSNTALGGWTALLEDLGADDFPDTSAAATPIQPGTVQGTVGFGGDVDWMRFDALPGHVYRISAASKFGGDLSLSLWTGPSATDPLASASGSAPTFTRKLATAGPWYLKVGAASPQAMGAYSVTLADLGDDDYPDEAASAEPLQPGQALSGAIDSQGDVDWFQFTAIPGHVYRMSAASGFAGMLTFSLWESPSATKPLATSFDKSVAFVRKLSSAGPWYLKVHAWSSTATGPYTVTVEDLGADDFGDLPADAGAVVVGSPVSASVGFEGDVDWMKFGATPGRVYRIQATSTFGGDLVFSLWADAASPNPVESLNGKSLVMTRELATAGPWLLKVRAYSATAMGAYTVLIEDLGSDDHPDSAAEADPLALETSAPGRVDYEGDVDWYRFSALEGHVYRVTGMPLYGAALTVALWESPSREIASEWGLVPTLTRKLTAGTRYVEVKAFGSTAVGDYTIEVEDLGPDDHGDTPSAATALTVGGSAVQGAIQFPGDEDYFSFKTTGTTLSYKLDTTGIGTSVQLFDSAGKATGTPLTGPAIRTFSVPSAGTWFLRVTALSASATGRYAIAVAP